MKLFNDPYRKIRAYHTSWLLQLTDWFTILPILKLVQRKTAHDVRLDYYGSREAIEADIKNGAFFMTNHRDIVMDSAWLSMLLRLRYNTRPYIGMGNNLFGKWWIEFLARYNRAFVVIRGGGLHSTLKNATLLSSYIRYLRDRKKSIWLAQREGRAKDGNDRTQGSVLKMLTMSEDGSLPTAENFIDNVRKLNICPVSISYEYDPCDFLKAQELQCKRDDPKWRKSKRDDLISMSTGIMGQKGDVIYRLTPSINHWLDANEQILRSLPLGEQIECVCHQVDQQIHLAYELYERGEAFEHYLDEQIEKVNIPNKDEDFLRATLHDMYQFIVTNHQAAVEYEKGHLCGKL